MIRLLVALLATIVAYQATAVNPRNA